MDYKQTLEYLANIRILHMTLTEKNQLEVIRTQALVIIAQSLEDIARKLEPGIKGNQAKK